MATLVAIFVSKCGLPRSGLDAEADDTERAIPEIFSESRKMKLIRYAVI